jgi:hypothetical protein
VSKLAIASIRDGQLPGEAGVFRGAVTASIPDGGGALQVRAWRVASDWSITYTDVASDVIAQDVSVAVVDDVAGGRELAVTAIRDASGNLRLIAWEIDASGNIYRADAAEDGSAGAISSLGVSVSRGSANDVLVGVRTGGGLHELMSWNVDTDGRLRRGGTIAADGAVAIQEVDYLTTGMSVASLKTSPGSKLRLVVWPTNLDPAL